MDNQEIFELELTRGERDEVLRTTARFLVKAMGSLYLPFIATGKTRG